MLNDRYVTVPLELLHLDPTNARKHGVKNLSAIKGSLAKFGQQKPIIITKSYVIIAGNGTYYAAKELGWKEIDCRITDLEGAVAMAYALADNRTAELAEWDMDILGKQLQALNEDNFGISEIGFDLGDFGFESKLKTSPDGSIEYGEGEFSKFAHQCPRCGFEFDGD